MWTQAQLQLFKTITDIETQQQPDINIVKFTDDQTRFLRLERAQVDYIIDNVSEVKSHIEEGKYSDFHLPRPYTTYKDLLELLLLVA